MKRFLFLLVSLMGLFIWSTPVIAQDIIEDGGYYYIYTIIGSKERALTVQGTRLCWDPTEHANPAFIFRLEKAETDNCYYMYNLKEDSWFNDITVYYFTEFKQGIENRAALIFEPEDESKTSFKIRPEQARFDWLSNPETNDVYGNFNCSDTRSFPTDEAYYHPLGQGTGDTWYLAKVDPSELRAAQMLVDLRKAAQLYTDNSIYTVGESTLITDVPADCDVETGQPGQIFSTCQSTDDTASSFANLIDGLITDRSHFQSSSVASAAPKPQFFQVDVSADDTDGKTISGLQLYMGLRPGGWGSAEFPIDITVYATNDESVAEDMTLTAIEDIVTKSSWVKIGDYDLSASQVLTTATSWPGHPRSAIVTSTGQREETKDIVFPGGNKYRFIRFYINNTAVNASDNHMFTLSELQLYELENPTASTGQAASMKALGNLIVADYAKVAALTVTDEDLTAIDDAMDALYTSKSDAFSNLQVLLDSINSTSLGISAGTEPGYNDPDKVAAYQAAYQAASEAIHNEVSDAEYIALANNLRATLVAAQAAINPVSEGYYNILNCYSNFSITMAMTGLPTQSITGWQMYDENNTAQLFHIAPLGDGTYSIQNVQTGKYFGTIQGTSQDVPVTDKQETAQTITAISANFPGQFNIANVANSIAYHAEWHQSGRNAKGYVCTWNDGANSCSAWRLVHVTGEKLDSLLTIAPQENMKAIAAHAIDTARAVYDKTFNYKQSAFLITNCDDTDPDNCQWWSLCQEPDASDYSSYSRLIDSDLGTCFQSTWNASIHEKPQWLQADLQDHPVKDFTLYYGLRDGEWGARTQITQITVFVTNNASVAKDEAIDTYEQVSANDDWKKVGVFDLPDNQAMLNYYGSNRTFTYDINNVLDQKYRFIRFYATHTYHPDPFSSGDNGTFTIGDLNIMENTYTEASAPYFYIDGLKDAADRLKAQEKLVVANMEANTVTQEQIDKLNELRALVTSLTPDRDVLQQNYNRVSAYINNFAAGEEYGDVSDAEWTAAQTALSNAKAVLDADQPSANEILAQQASLTETYNTFKASQKQFEPNKWYYIVSRCNTRNGSIEKNGEGETAGTAHESSIYSTFCYGNVAYAPSDNTRAAQGNWGTNNNNALKWGYYAAGEEKGGAGGSELYADNLDPHTMWRLIPIEGKDGQYAIQNRATGRFWSSYSGNSWQQLGTDTAAFVFDFLGSGVYKFRAASATVYMQPAGDGYMYSYNADLDDPNGQVSFTLEPVETADNVVMEYPNDNSIFIKSLPYAIDATTVATNAGYVDIYGIKGLEVVGSDSTLLLEKKTSVEAGEPFIAIAGDYTAFDAANTTTATLVLPSVDEFSFEGKTVNGLTAALDYTRAPKAGLGYFVNAVVTATEAGTGIEGHTGYFNVNDMTLFTTETEADARISLSGSGINAIKSITTGKDGVVNVYSIDGKLIKKNVNRSKAGKGLQKGLYIVGKKKVSVK